MSGQRWFANKGVVPALQEIGSWELPSPAPGLRIITRLVVDPTPGKRTLYQVPLTYRSSPIEASGAFIGMDGSSHVYDGPHDPGYTAALLDLIANARTAGGHLTTATGVCTAPSVGSGLVSRVLGGEQSNTSIVFEHPDTGNSNGAPVICKLFRALHHGDNPEVTLQTALSTAGSTAVPGPIGHVEGTWPDQGQPGGQAAGHLAFAQEFLVGARDGWQLAISSAADGVDFSSNAHELGRMTAEVHRVLLGAMPSGEMTPGQIGETIRGMHGRLDAALHEAPELEQASTAIRAIFERARSVGWPARQRIHGDLHLGQVLRSPGGGWAIVDFEGEPLRPMDERATLDSPLRDVAGMLRSFDYVVGSMSIGGAAPVAYWAGSARRAFEEGYTGGQGWDSEDQRVVVEAFEMDKALYEIVYEARNRPGWLSIPLTAIQRLSAGAHDNRLNGKN